jgi:hypothetical protein
VHCWNPCQDIGRHHQMGQRFLVRESSRLLADWSSRLWQNHDCIHHNQEIRERWQRWPTHGLGWQLSLLATIRRNPGTTRIIPTIAYQLSRKCKSYASALHTSEQFRRHPSRRPHPVEGSSCWTLAADRESTLPLYLIVIDALDEINGMEGQSFLRDLLTAIDEYNLRGFQVSRDEPTRFCSRRALQSPSLPRPFVGSNACRSRMQSWILDLPEDQAAEAR